MSKGFWGQPYFMHHHHFFETHGGMSICSLVDVGIHKYRNEIYVIDIESLRRHVFPCDRCLEIVKRKYLAPPSGEKGDS